MRFLAVGLLPVGGKREKKTFDILKNLSKSVVKSVENFEKGVEKYSEQDFDKGEEFLHRVDELESKADEYGFKFEYELRGGAFLPAFRGDLSKLAESIDDIADKAEEAIREIHRRPQVFKELAEAEKEKEEISSLRNGLVDLAGKSVAAARTADNAISILMENMDEAAERAEEIHRRERESDTQEDQLAVDLYKYEEYLTPITVMQIKGLINKFGDISDAAEDSGDTISAMTISLKA